MKISYSINLTPPASQPPKPPEPLAEYSYNEFWLDLPTHWRQIATSEDRTLNWQSEVDKAAIIVSVDFYQVPDEKAHALAEVCLQSRLDALEQVAPAKVEVLNRSIKPYSQGGGLELSLAAQTPEDVHIYLGYVTPRKVFNFSLICGPDKHAAADLFNKTMKERLRVKVP